MSRFVVALFAVATLCACPLGSAKVEDEFVPPFFSGGFVAFENEDEEGPFTFVIAEMYSNIDGCGYFQERLASDRDDSEAAIEARGDHWSAVFFLKVREELDGEEFEFGPDAEEEIDVSVCHHTTDLN